MQMHNRHFITSMVINGEKAPAFSATTLTLPPTQTDFSPQIIANTRLRYARPRHEIQEEIQRNIGGSQPQQQQPQSAAQQRQHPIPASNKPATPAPKAPLAAPTQPAQRPHAAIPANQAPANPTPVATAQAPGIQAAPIAPQPTDATQAKKRRRRRRGGKGSGSAADQQPQAPVFKPQLPPATPHNSSSGTSDGTEIRLR